MNPTLIHIPAIAFGLCLLSCGNSKRSSPPPGIPVAHPQPVYGPRPAPGVPEPAPNTPLTSGPCPAGFTPTADGDECSCLGGEIGGRCHGLCTGICDGRPSNAQPCPGVCHAGCSGELTDPVCLAPR